MIGEQQEAAGRRRTRAEVRQLVAEFVNSGMRRSEFCRSRGLSYSTLDRHLKKRRWKRKTTKSAPADGKFVAVELALRKPLAEPGGELDAPRSSWSAELDPYRKLAGGTATFSCSPWLHQIIAAKSPLESTLELVDRICDRLFPASFPNS
jgi:hypothetical protein